MEVTDLPEDILLQVLGRLDKLSERRLRAVSKTWRDLSIKAEAAAASAPIRYLDSGLAFYDSDDDDDDDMRLYRLDNRGGLTNKDLPLKHKSVSFMGSCNGVLFYCTDYFLDAHPSCDHCYHVYNPLTDQISTLPHSDFTRDGPMPDLIGLALDKKSSHYKLVAFYSSDDHPKFPFSVAIFNSKTGEWKTNPVKFAPYHDPDKLGELDGNSVYVNGILYWLNNEGQELVSFFVEEEVFRAFKLPKAVEIRYPETAPAIWESEKGLKYGQICKRKGLCIWVLHHPHEIGRVNDDVEYLCDIAGCTDENNGWKLIFRISSETLIAKLSTVIEINNFDEVVRVLAFNEELYLVHIETTKSYISYNIPENRVSLLQENKNMGTLELPLTYRWFELPEFGYSGRKRKNQDEV